MPGIGKKKGGTKGAISHPRKLKQNKRLQQDIQKKQSTNAKWDATTRTVQNTQETDM